MSSEYSTVHSFIDLYIVSSVYVAKIKRVIFQLKRTANFINFTSVINLAQVNCLLTRQRELLRFALKHQTHQ